MSRPDIDTDDAIEIGLKVAEMAERVRKFDKIVPGAQAKWFFECDDVRFKVVITVDHSVAAPEEAGA